MTKRPASMTRRLILWLTAATVAFWTAAAAFGTLVMREEFDEVFDSGLQETAQRLMPLVVDDLFQRDEAAGPRQADEAGVPDHGEYLTYQVRDRDGRVLLHSHDAPATPFDVALVPGFQDTPSHRIYTEAAVSGSIFLQVADPLDHRWEATWEGSMALVLPLLFLAPVSVLAIWLIVRSALSPIASLQQEIAARDGANLAPLLVGGLPDELGGIVSSVDRLLERLRSALEAEREFAANSAHELRTPIAGALAQMQRLIAETSGGNDRTRALEIEGSLKTLSRLTEKLLQLARADAGIGASTRSVDLVPVARMVVDDFRRHQPTAERLVLGVRGDAPLMRAVDVDAFAIALRNLIENALIHGAASGPVTVSVDPSGAVAVRNAGPVVPVDQLAQLTQRFRRGRTGARGSGLGLAIADRLTAQMGGSLTLNSPAPGSIEGFEARIRL